MTNYRYGILQTAAGADSTSQRLFADFEKNHIRRKLVISQTKLIM